MLSLVDEHGEPYWTYEWDGEEISIPKLTVNTFLVVQSMRGATRGNNSDPTGIYDNKSDTKSQTSSHSS